MKVSGRILLGAAGIAGAAWLAYGNTFAVPFVFDDGPSILDNPTIRALWPLRGPLSPPGGFGFTVSGRPLLNFTLALNYAISGTDVGSYHVFNLLIHIGAGLTLFGLVRRTLARPLIAERVRALALPAAWVIALLWTLHPLQTESVTYVIQRAESLMGLFFLLTVYSFVRAAEAEKPRGWQAVAVTACALGMGCKEVMVTAPVVVLLYDRTFFAGGFREAWRSRRGFYAALALTWVPLVWLVAGTGGDRGGTFTFTPAACGAFWLTQCEAVMRYVELSLWPAPLIFDYGVGGVARISRVLPAMAGVALLLGMTSWAWWRRPVLEFLGATFFLILAPTSVVPGVGQAIVEHRMYLPLAAVMALVVAGAARGWGVRGLWCGVALAVVAGGLTWRRNEVYRSDLGLWQDTVAKRPQSAKAQANLGTMLFDRGRYAEALPHYREALRLDPARAQSHFNLGLALGKVGDAGGAIEQFAEAVRLLPVYPQAHAMLGAALTRQRKFDVAIAHLRLALRYDPEMAAAHYSLGVALAETGKPAEACAHYERALRFQPDDAEAECNFGAALFRLGRSEEATRRLERAIRLRPDLADAHYNLGLVLAAAGRADEAFARYNEAVRWDANHAEAQLNLGIMLAQNARLPEALVHLEQAVRARPEFAEAHANLGNVLGELGRLEEAAGSYAEALRLRPGYAVAHLNFGNVLARLGRRAEANRHWEEALRLGREHAE